MPERVIDPAMRADDGHLLADERGEGSRVLHDGRWFEVVVSGD